jgi:adenosylmethionine-8-amino-7-oxononanoate aminotransferase
MSRVHQPTNSLVSVAVTRDGNRLGSGRAGHPATDPPGQAGLAPAGALPDVANVRVLGAIGAMHLDDAVDVAAAREAAAERGVWLRPFRDLVYTMPRNVCIPDELNTLTAGA